MSLLMRWVPVALGIVVLAASVETFVAAGMTVLLLFPWTGATEAIRASAHALLAGGAVVAATSVAFGWLAGRKIT